MARTFKDIARHFPRIAIEAVSEWIEEKYFQVLKEVRDRAREETYGGKFSESIRFGSRQLPYGAEGEVFSNHPRAKHIIKVLEEGRGKYVAQRAFFIEKPDKRPGDKITGKTSTGEDWEQTVTTNKEGIPGIWVTKSGPVSVLGLWKKIAREPPKLEKLYSKAVKKYLGGR